MTSQKKESQVNLPQLKANTESASQENVPLPPAATSAAGAAAGGAAIGHLWGGSPGAIVGALTGAIIGGALGKNNAEHIAALERQALETLGVSSYEDTVPAHYSREELQALSKPEPTHMEL